MDGVKSANIKRLYGLLDRYTVISGDGFAVDIEREYREWDRCAKAVGIHSCYKYMSSYLAARYEERYAKPFLFDEECVAYEIEYHFDAFMWSQGLRGYTRNITTLLFSREELISHCRVINISTADVRSLRQRAMFSYRRGVRSCYRGTDEDPFIFYPRNRK